MPTLSHPLGQTVSVHCDNKTVEATVRKWKMRDRAALKPRLLSLFEKMADVKGDAITFALAPMMLHAEEEIYEIAKASTLLPDEVAFDDLDLDDLVDLAQAVWTTNVMSADGGGLVGKLGSLLAPLTATPSVPKTENELNGQASASLHENGEQVQNSSS